jgi:hypothetical protein
MADAQTVWELSLVPGSGYSNGTYALTATGCSGSSFAGTVTVAGGILSSYVISNQGSGYTCRPTIAVPAGAGAGSGGIIQAAVEQATPHNTSPTYNLPGVDYYIGPNGPLTTPNSGNVPACTSLSGTTLTITSVPCTVDHFDLTNILVVVPDYGGPSTGAGPGCDLAVGTDTHCVKFTNDKFVTQTGVFQALQIGDTTVGYGASDVEVKYSDLSDAARLANNNNSVAVVWLRYSNGGSLVFEYNFCHEINTKCIAGLSPGGTPVPLYSVEKYNYFRNCTMGYGGGHGECEYYFGNSASITVYPTASFNVYHDQWDVMAQSAAGCGAPGTCETSLNASAHNDGPLAVANVVDDYNYLMGEGPYALINGSNPGAHGITGSADFFVGGASNGEIKNNFVNYSGKFAAYNGPLTAYIVAGNVNSGTGGTCNSAKGGC